MEQLVKKINTYFEAYEPVEIATGVIAGVLVIQGVKYLVFNFDEAKNSFFKTTFGLLKAVPGVNQKVREEQLKMRAKMIENIEAHALQSQEKVIVIPPKGIPHDEVLRRMKELKDNEATLWKSGKISGAIYGANESHYELQNKAYAMFSISNPLHPDLFPSIRKFEGEIIKMTIAMLNGSDKGVVGAVTSGGTESIIMAVKAHRDYYSNIKYPEIIVPVTAHAAFDKAGDYLRIKVIHVPIDQDGKADVKAVRRALSRNTILIVGSAPGFPHGIIDPIEELADIAKEHGCGFHTDACLGGFYLPWAQKHSKGKIPPFDFRVPGVTSISCDTHKYGFATKGTSVLLFKTEELRHAMYFVTTEWPGGVYASPTMAGSRPGGLIACCWASLVAMGQEGYTKIAEGIYDAVQEVKEGVRNIPKIELVGDSYSSVVAFASKELDIYKISDAMKSRGWNLNNLTKPNSIHICLTANHVGKAKEIVKDLKDSVEEVANNPKKYADGASAIYGLAGSFPDRTAVKDLALMYIDALLST